MSALAEALVREAATAQRPAAEPDRSLWVAASAGTGKTKVLTDRVLSLMLHGTAPGRILCLTFTKAAAAEMANRLAQRLARWAIHDDATVGAEIAGLLGSAPDAETLGRARRLFARVLDAPGGMKILTIHAFCQSLLRRFPLEAGIAPHFQVLDERSATEMLFLAREAVLAGAPATDGAVPGNVGASLGEAIAEVATYAQGENFAALMAELIGERARLERLIREQGGIEAVIAAAGRLLGADPKEDPEAALAEGCADDAVDQLGLRLVVAALAAGTAREKALAPRLQAWLEADRAGRLSGFAGYAGLFLTQKDEVRKDLLTKSATAAVPGALAIMAAEAQRLVSLRARLAAIRVARASAGLLRLGAAILEVYRRHKQARALLDYDDLILAARDLLARQGNASWVLYKLDGGLDHILIDEAQDTNPEQWEVVERLAEEFFTGLGAREASRTVFAVGDPKQSIFSFQRADPAAFERLRGHFAARARGAGQVFQSIGLAHSFRSCAAVLQAVDAVFAQAPASDGVRPEGEPLAHQPVRLGQAGLVELWPPAEPPDAEAEEDWTPPVARRGALPARSRLAKLIARKIARWTRRGPKAREGESEAWLESRGRWMRPGDILVLVRRRNEFVEELVRELKRLEVPVAGVDRMVLHEQLAVMDLVALGRVLLLPEDDLTLACVLKGPLIGLDEDQLFALAHGRTGSLWQALETAAAAPGAAPDFVRARDELARLRTRADFVPPYELFVEALTRDWGIGRGRARLLARLGPDADDPIEEFLSLALAYQREHVPSLEGFLHWLEVGAQEVKRDMEHGHDAVRVMTVHGAKGLQAPVVILPDTLQGPPAKTGLFWFDEPERTVLWPLRQAYDGEHVQAAREADRQARAQEYRRLLYVALTRAEDRLYVCGWKTSRTAPADSWYKLVEAGLGGLAEPCVFDFSAESGTGWAGPGWRLANPQTAKADRVTDEGPPGLLPAAALPAWADRPAPAEPTPPRPLAPSRPAASEPAVLSPLDPDSGRRFKRGRLIHRLLQSLPELPPDRQAAAAARFLAAPAQGLTDAEQAEIARVTLAVLEAPELAPLFGPESRAEVPVVGLLAGARGPEVVAGQVDRLVVTGERVLVVDYKSNRPAPAQESEVPALYLRQMSAYRAVLARVYPERSIACALLWTDGPRLMQLSDAALEAHAP